MWGWSVAMTIKHYRVEFTEAEEPTGMAGQAIRSCSGCGIIICGQGGGGTYLCDLCVKDMLYMLDSGQLKECIGGIKKQWIELQSA
jgi:hypothetical protein